MPSTPALTGRAREGRILVTGAAGFLGRHLVRALHAQGLDVLAVDNLCVPPVEAPPDDLLCASVLDLTAEDLRGVTCIYHLSAWKSVPDSFSHPYRCVENVRAGEHVLRLARAAGVARVVVASSCEVYGTTQTPTREDAPLAPRSAYAMSKAAVDCLAAVVRRGGQDVTVARLFNVYGPGERPDAVVPAFCQGALVKGEIVVEGSGRQRRDFSYVTDIVARLVELSLVETCPAIVNLGSGTSHTILELSSWMTRRRPETTITFGPERPLEIEEFRADTALADALFTASDPVGLEAGLEETFSWWEWYADRV
ncbi:MULTISPECIES: NAD-dependent epimerase/dehydratase family protein [unclassified Streptomyces]|uniref:NAD-dependent epimerase/dehydratase family protein n=1 Tax=Streptomyces TaxID=1883 RepID=UPI0013700EDF|nr:MULTISPECIES: NAD-dependent epimerase/dehydratase family protein [unclassified Streptomyces]MYY87081.1 NAD-dependent epimerase/dehydratase family protein [Streptomyces sp. SID335]MYZ18125.1 NAD-dependent epimerase/dehydratase family protein [Streptomyces sp. SID337]NDZ89498.1 NAD-dependent epimerase/dehydratase family protein [Streptomyces sp. SID10115]NEA05116.1 NAD-dependent epimerase/dehydratase family protein [Streptomyces sp. SID10116]